MISPLDIIIEHPVLGLVSLEETECSFRVEVLVLDYGRGEYGGSSLHEFVHESSSLSISIGLSLVTLLYVPLPAKLAVFEDRCREDLP